VARSLTPDTDIEALELLIKAARLCPNDRPEPGACSDPDALEDTLDPHETTLFLFEMCTEHRPPTRRHAALRLVLATGLDPNTLDPYDGVLPAPVVSLGEPSPDDDPDEDEEAPALFGPATFASSFVATDGTALHQLTAIGDLDGMRLLLEAGANPNARDASGGTPLHVAARVTPSDARLVRTLHAAGADPDATDRYDRTPLHVAAERGNVRAVLELAHLHANLDGHDRRGRTPLMRALAHEDPRTLVSLLVRKGADLEARDPVGCTVLIRAAKAARGDLVELMLELGADRFARDHTDTDALTHLWAATHVS
jgi:ankyrin repeat protein